MMLPHVSAVPRIWTNKSCYTVNDRLSIGGSGFRTDEGSINIDISWFGYFSAYSLTNSLQGPSFGLTINIVNWIPGTYYVRADYANEHVAGGVAVAVFHIVGYYC